MTSSEGIRSTTRTCASCGGALPSDAHFNRQRCTTCSVEHERGRARLKAKQWYEANAERALASRKRWQQSHPAENCAYVKKWRDASPENKAKAVSWTKAWMSAHPEKRRAYYHRWYIENQASLRKLYSERKAVYAASDFTFDQWLSILEVFGGRCAYCLEVKKLTMDHVIPVSDGGQHTSENIVPACQSCNSRKNNRLIFTMLRKVA